MNFARRSALTASVVLSMALLTACGGDSDSAPTLPPVVNLAPVTTMLLSGMMEAGTDGADATAGIGSDLILSGASSTDANGDTLTFKWSVVSKPETSKLALTTDTNVKQVIRADVAGMYVLNLRVTDSKGSFSEKKVSIMVRENVAPITNVVVTATYTGLTMTAPAQSLHVGSAVVLDAKGSKDADGDVVKTTWTLLEKPSTSTTSLTVDGETSHFVADVQGAYKIRAHGVDPTGAYSETVYTFNADNRAPTTVVVASAVAPAAAKGASITAAAGYLVSLQSYTADNVTGGAAKSDWVLVSVPEGSNATLSAATGAISQIRPDRLGDYVVKLTATDSTGAISSQLTTVSVKNHSPYAQVSANAGPVAVQSGPSVRLALNAPVTLRGTGSKDADGDVLTYAWTLSKPAGSTAVLSAADQDTVQFTPDARGSYEVLLRVTDSKGATSEQTSTFQAGSYSPVAVLDKNFVTVAPGGSVSASAELSFDVDSGALTYSWAIDAAPAGSTATIAAPTAPTLAFTPDLPGTYVASLTVSDGTSTSVATLPIRVMGSMTASVELNFAPLDVRYSKGSDQMVFLSTNPNAVKIVDPFSGMVKTVVLPLSGVALNVSPDGKLAAVLQEGIVSLIDMDAGTLIRSSTTPTSFSEVFVNDAGIVHLLGRRAYSDSWSGAAVFNGRTGADLTTTLGSTSGNQISDNYRGVYSTKKSRAFLSHGQSSSGYLVGLDIDAATGKIGASVSNYDYASLGMLYLSENHDLLFTSSGGIYRTDTLKAAGKLSGTTSVQSLSHSSLMNETLVLSTTTGSYPDYSPQYPSVIKRYVGALFVADADLALPMINAQQSYGINIFHTTTGKQVALVQTVTSKKDGPGVRYFVVTR